MLGYWLLNQIQHMYCINRALASVPTWAVHWVSPRDVPWTCSFMCAPACLKNSAARHLRTYTSDAPACFRRRGGRRGLLSETIYQDVLHHRDSTYASSAGLLAYAPSILELPPQVGVSGGVRPSAPAAAPSGGGPGRCTAECAGCYPLSR
jgi:hypothetical protein